MRMVCILERRRDREGIFGRDGGRRKMFEKGGKGNWRNLEVSEKSKKETLKREE